MILMLAIIGFVWALAGLCDDYDHEAERRNDYRIAERRHREKLDAIRNSSSSRGSGRL
jgi:hypothetical protein